MRLADQYPPEELPTRPDLPKTAARKCKSCGKVYGEHVISRPPGLRHVHIVAACGGLRRNFQPEGASDADRER